MTNNSLLATSIVFVLCSLLAGCYTHLRDHNQLAAAAATYTLERTIENIVYTDASWPEPLGADLYLPGKRGPHPVVLMIHGGGWANRSRKDMIDVSRKLVRHGYAVFNISYRFAPRFTYPAQLQDLQQALQWISQNAGQFDLDTDRINTWGYSSGAHLAALVASIDSVEASVAEVSELPRINAVVAGGIPSDLRKYSGSQIVMRFMGGDRDDMPERYAAASPAYHVSRDDPPVFLYHGELDVLVSDDQATDYYEALKERGVEAELYLHNWRGHMTMFLLGDDAENKAINFLNRKNSRTLTVLRQ
ncbi:MAG TPA: alpha/beta hydrolase [Gammaproteobacteria bacterium]|nr:alpha/beta hydrolase [Gammaproteobacteria bacterium]